MARIFTVTIAALIMSFAANTAICMTEGLKNFLNDNPTVKIYLDIGNTSSDKNVDPALIKKFLEEGFLARKSYNFIIVNSAQEADLVLKGDIKEYVWQEFDPVDQVWGVGSAAMDAATSDNYARMQVQMELISAKNNRILWSDKVQSTMTQHIMPKDSSYELVYKRFVKSFMKEVFRKRAS